MNQTILGNVRIGYYVRAKKEVEHALKPREIKYAIDLREFSIYLGIQKELYWWKRLLNILFAKNVKNSFPVQGAVINSESSNRP